MILAQSVGTSILGSAFRIKRQKLREGKAAVAAFVSICHKTEIIGISKFMTIVVPQIEEVGKVAFECCHQFDHLVRSLGAVGQLTPQII